MWDVLHQSYFSYSPNHKLNFTKPLDALNCHLAFWSQYLNLAAPKHSLVNLGVSNNGSVGRECL